MRGDSELIIKQVKGEYRVKNEGLKTIYFACKNLIPSFAERYLSTALAAEARAEVGG